MRIIIINGPNLNLVGKREPELYGDKSMDTYMEELKKEYDQVDIEYYQSNIEGELINKLQEVGFDYDGILFNAGGYTHTSVAIADAIAAIRTPVVEVHITDPKKREDFRHVSLIESNCVATVSGLGLESYKRALQTFLSE